MVQGSVFFPGLDLGFFLIPGWGNSQISPTCDFFFETWDFFLKSGIFLKSGDFFIWDFFLPGIFLTWIFFEI